jgi:hypothetical protein
MPGKTFLPVQHPMEPQDKDNQDGEHVVIHHFEKIPSVQEQKGRSPSLYLFPCPSCLCKALTRSAAGYPEPASLLCASHTTPLSLLK